MKHMCASCGYPNIGTYKHCERCGSELIKPQTHGYAEKVEPLSRGQLQVQAKPVQLTSPERAERTVLGTIVTMLLYTWGTMIQFGAILFLTSPDFDANVRAGAAVAGLLVLIIGVVRLLLLLIYHKRPYLLTVRRVVLSLFALFPLILIVIWLATTQVGGTQLALTVPFLFLYGTLVTILATI